MKNNENGRKCEHLVAETLSSYGYWVCIIPHSESGSQPVDIIALKKDSAILCDAKNVSAISYVFPLSRIEANQWTTLKYAREYAGLDNLGFAINFECDGKLRWLSYDRAIAMKKLNQPSIRFDVLPLFEKLWN